MHRLTILLVDSNAAEVTLLAATLKELNLKVLPVMTMSEAILVIESREPVHAMLANWVQQGASGLELAAAAHLHAIVPIPVVLYSQSVDDGDALFASGAGVEAVLRLPLSQPDLYKQLIPVLRGRYPWAYNARSVIGDIEIDSETFVVTRRGRRVHLTLSEFRLLELLARKPGEVLSREELMAAFSKQKNSSIRAVDVQITRLKAALTVGGKAPPIRAVRGRGYVLG